MNRGTFGAGASASYHSDRLLTGESCHSTCHGETDFHGILTVLHCHLILSGYISERRTNQVQFKRKSQIEISAHSAPPNGGNRLRSPPFPLPRPSLSFSMMTNIHSLQFLFPFLLFEMRLMLILITSLSMRNPSLFLQCLSLTETCCLSSAIC